MGAYLSQPNTVKSSFDGGSQKLGFGFSAMQGWRVSMEDAHNCIPELDSETAMFAVYDGHGGEEVALYCAKYLPEIIKEQKAYKEGKLQKALENAFLAIDGKLTTEEVIKELAQISGRAHEDEDEKVKVADEDDVDNEEAALLHEEATMTIEELLTRYGQNLNCAKALKSKGSVPRQPPAEEAREEGEKKKTEKDLNGELECRDAGGDHKKDSKSGKAEEEVVAAAATGISSSSDGAAAGGSAGGSARKAEASGTEEAVSSSTGDAGPSCSSSTGKAQRATKSKFFEDSEDESEEAEEEDDDDSEECSEEDEEGEGDYSSEDDDEEEEEDEEGDDGDAEEEDDMMLPGMDGKEEPGSDSGTTAVVALIRGKQLIVANAGDSRCVVSEGGKAVDMSYDHKPEDELELARIKNAGGKVTMDGRVNGGLNLSRAIGDHFYKRNKSLPPEEQMICAMPDVKVLPLNNDHEFMVIACDGIWNVMTSQEVIDFVHERIKQEDDTGAPRTHSSIVEELLDHCLAPDTSGDGTGCDNMTCIIVSFRGRQEQKAQPEASCKRKLEEVVQAEENGGDSVKKAKAE
ncbi:protein phosphatase 1G [Latimeria chalumnae]|uniref:protein phosphatase 1G n=1 Tax=Latimeria chalumnae TaxID=7897 RepID=UPI0006D93940|nr:PREDICTED: protein phosphatase 1G [Latimeria chalumnae]|eukprot:XP_014345859.1 PREDICTED: protein phosphatase 1G [Latimeria chalumnae]